MPHDAIGNIALYELKTNWIELDKFQWSGRDDALLNLFATFPNTIVSKLSVEHLLAVCSVVIDLENNKTSLWNNSVTYTIS